MSSQNSSFEVNTSYEVVRPTSTRSTDVHFDQNIHMKSFYNQPTTNYGRNGQDDDDDYQQQQPINILLKRKANALSIQDLMCNAELYEESDDEDHSFSLTQQIHAFNTFGTVTEKIEGLCVKDVGVSQDKKIQRNLQWPKLRILCNAVVAVTQQIEIPDTISVKGEEIRRWKTMATEISGLSNPKDEDFSDRVFTRLSNADKDPIAQVKKRGLRYFSREDNEAFFASILSLLATVRCDACIINTLKRDAWDGELQDFAAKKFSLTNNGPRSSKTLSSRWKRLILDTNKLRKQCIASKLMSELDIKRLIELAKTQVQHQSRNRLSCTMHKSRSCNVVHDENKRNSTKKTYNEEDRAAFLQGISEYFSVHVEADIVKALRHSVWNNGLKDVMDKHFNQTKNGKRSGTSLKLQWTQLVKRVRENGITTLEMDFAVPFENIKLDLIEKIVKSYVDDSKYSMGRSSTN